MKTRTIFISLLLAAVCAAPVFGRTFKSGDKIYVHADQTVQNTPEDNKGGFDWTVSNAKLFLYVFDGDGDKFIELVKKEGKTYMATMPSGTWKKCIVTRQDPGKYTPSWDAVWTQTSDLYIPDDAVLNGIRKMPEKDKVQDTYWTHFVPEAANIGQYVKATEEHFSICENAFGGPYALHTKLTSDKSAYDHTGIKWHAWFRSYDKQTWTALDKYAGTVHDGETLFDLPDNVLPKLSEVTSNPKKVYYFLYSTDATGQRLISLTPDAKGCDLDCTITSFEVACSAVNANDTTYTLDGMVAFGEPNGDLVIRCDNKSVTINAADAKSPQTFSIKGLRAALTEGRTTTATAEFRGNSGCTKTVEVKIPNATQGIIYKHIDLLVGETTPLTPSVTPNYDNKHIWYVNGKEQPSMQGKQSSTAFFDKNTTYYTYREFYPEGGGMGNMMSNGSYEDDFNYGTKWQKSLISDYEFWGKYETTSQINFYTDTVGAGCINPNKRSDNGFAVVKSANNFFYTFAKVKAREGSYFALFDAASDGVSGKKAWFANTEKNPNLKLQKGTTYLFSFWAANINNYGEMDNAAKLQFQITYNGKTEKLGKVLDLGSAEFRNNRWHQCSATFYADADASNVTISVVNLNTNKLNTGNDFALDDIQFRAVSSATRAVRIQQVFEVQTHEPHVYKLTATAQPMACDETSYKVSITVTYDNPKGKLVIMDVTAGKEVFNGTVPTQGADWDKQKTKTVSVQIDGLEPAEHQYKAYFAEWPKSYAEGSSTAPAFTNCCVEGLMFRKWENVLFIDNGKGLFTAYQWYKNDKKLQGETKQRYYTGQTPMAGTSDTYYCEVTRKDGTTEKTCPHTFDECPRSAEQTAVEDIMLDGIAVWPTQVPAGANITISKTFAGSVRATLLTLTGQTVSTNELRGDESTMAMPEVTGIYLLQLQGTSTQRTVKINVY